VGGPVELRAGDRVALLVPGSVAYVDLVISLLAAGIFPIPLDPSLTAAERDRILPTLRPTVVVDGADALAELAAHVDDLGDPGRLPRGRPMPCPSGTPGTPQGGFTGLLSAAAARALVAEDRDLWGFRADDVNLVLRPLHHSAPLRFAIGTMLAGGRVVVPLTGNGPFDPATVTAAVERERPTTMFCVPAHLQRLFAHWDAVGVPDLSSFRLVAHAGAPCPESVKRRLVELFPPRTTWGFYGSTEGQFTACRSEEWLERPGTLGRPRPGRRMSADPDGTLWCTVPSYARFEYFGDPAKTAAAWRGDAFTVGDLGRIDDDGYVWLDGRREDLVISGGVNVYPAEVEAVLREAPGVDDVAVYGADDERWGQRVCAAYVGSAEPDSLRAFARERLAPAKRPKDYRRMPDLPRTSTGKVRRLELSTHRGE
jgi:long-chain acyl-CoA synthetase